MGAYSAGDNTMRECTEWDTCSPGSYFATVPNATFPGTCEPCGTEFFSELTDQEECLPHTQCASGQFVERVSAHATSNVHARAPAVGPIAAHGLRGWRRWTCRVSPAP